VIGCPPWVLHRRISFVISGVLLDLSQLVTSSLDSSLEYFVSHILAQLHLSRFFFKAYSRFLNAGERRQCLLDVHHAMLTHHAFDL